MQRFWYTFKWLITAVTAIAVWLSSISVSGELWGFWGYYLALMGPVIIAGLFLLFVSSVHTLVEVFRKRWINYRGYEKKR